MERVMIFIDGSNFYHGFKDCLKNTKLEKAKIDIEKFCNILTGRQRRLIQVYYYNVSLKQKDDPQKYSKQQRFIQAIKKIPHLTVKLGRRVKRDKINKCHKCGKSFAVIKCPNCKADLEPFTYTEKGVDVSIAVDMIVNAIDNTYDTAILVSGDGDFVPVVQEVKRIKNVENAYFLNEVGKRYYISKTCKFIELTKEYLKDCLLHSSSLK